MTKGPAGPMFVYKVVTVSGTPYDQLDHAGVVAQPVPPPKKKRRGDSSGTGVRTVKNGRVRWNGGWYSPAPWPFEDAYDGSLEGQRFMFRQSYTNGMLALHKMMHYDNPTIRTKWNRWVRDDIFDN